MITNLVHINEILGIEGLETSDEGSFLNQDALQSINDRLTTIIAERDTAITERDTAITERDNINTDLTNLGQRLAQTETERDTAITERDTATTECDTAITERDTAITERDTANTELQNNETALNAIGQTVADATGFTEKSSSSQKNDRCKTRRKTHWKQHNLRSAYQCCRWRRLGYNQQPRTQPNHSLTP